MTSGAVLVFCVVKIRAKKYSFQEYTKTKIAAVVVHRPFRLYDNRIISVGRARGLVGGQLLESYCRSLPPAA